MKSKPEVVKEKKVIIKDPKNVKVVFVDKIIKQEGVNEDKKDQVKFKEDPKGVVVFKGVDHFSKEKVKEVKVFLKDEVSLDSEEKSEDNSNNILNVLVFEEQPEVVVSTKFEQVEDEKVLPGENNRLFKKNEVVIPKLFQDKNIVERKDVVKVSPGNSEFVRFDEEVVLDEEPGMDYATKLFEMTYKPEVVEKTVVSKMELEGARMEFMKMPMQSTMVMDMEERVEAQPVVPQSFSGFYGQHFGEERQQRRQNEERQQAFERAESSNVQVEGGVNPQAKGPASLSESFHLSANTQISSVILNQIRQFRESGRAWMRVPLSFAGGKSASMHLSAHADHIQVKFSGDVEGFQDEVSGSWEALRERALEQGIRLEEVAFV